MGVFFSRVYDGRHAANKANSEWPSQQRTLGKSSGSEQYVQPLDSVRSDIVASAKKHAWLLM